MIVIIQMIQCLFAGFSVGIYAILETLPIYEQLSGIKEQIIAGAFNIPVIIVSVITTLFTIGKIAYRLLLRKK